LEINFIDVMGGAATLIVTPDRESVLIDSGWPGFDDRDPERIVHVLKDLAGCDHLDHLVTTHWHRDHFGGVAGLARRIRIDHFWDRGLPRMEPDSISPTDPSPTTRWDSPPRGQPGSDSESGRLVAAGVAAAVLSGGEVIQPSQRFPGRSPRHRQPALRPGPPTVARSIR
jgi:glyoxylase-like metal-dependent hydrolase (beta-lactamase superfamily II)